jgi:hypothetical protein
VNGIFWALGLEEQIKADLNIAFVGPFPPNPLRTQLRRQSAGEQQNATCHE